MEDEELFASYELEGENFRYQTQGEYEAALRILSLSKDELKMHLAENTVTNENESFFYELRGHIDDDLKNQRKRVWREAFMEAEGGGLSVDEAGAEADKRVADVTADRIFARFQSQASELRAESALREKKATMSEDEFKLAVFSAKARKKSRRESEAEVAMSFTDMARQDDALMDFRPEAVLSQPQTQTAFPTANNQNPGNQQRIVNTAPRKVKTETGGVLDVTNEDVSAVPA